MTFYFYLDTTPTENQISQLKEIPFFANVELTIFVEELTGTGEIRVNVTPLRRIFLLDNLLHIQRYINEIFPTSTVFVK